MTILLAGPPRPVTVAATPGGPPPGGEPGASGCSRVVDSGVYVLGALSRAEHADYAAHLQGCATCRHEVGRLAPLPGLLGGATRPRPAAGRGVGEPDARRAAVAIAVAALAAAARQTGHRTTIRAPKLPPRRTP